MDSVKQLIRVSLCVFRTLCVLILLSSNAEAFTLMFWSDGSPLFGWPSDSVRVDTNLTQCTSNIDSLINTAMSTWSQLDGSNLVISRGSSVTTASTTAYAQATAGTPVIVCDQSLLANFGAGLTGVLGFVAVKAKDTGSHVTYAPMILNFDASAIGNLALFQTPVVQSVIAHEMGHMMGIGHSTDTKALMYPSIDPNTKLKFNLAKDDVDAMTWIYPRSEFQGGLFGCGTIEDINSKSGDGGSGWAEVACLLVFFALIVWIFKSKRSIQLRYEEVLH
jgi:hypothetical protein